MTFRKAAQKSQVRLPPTPRTGVSRALVLGTVPQMGPAVAVPRDGLAAACGYVETREELAALVSWLRGTDCAVCRGHACVCVSERSEGGKWGYFYCHAIEPLRERRTPMELR